MSSAPFESQTELDREIARLEQQLLDLKQRRNAMSPVSRIPPELLSNIFFLSLRFLKAGGITEEVDPDMTRRAICAVSHQWRELAFTEPKLWMEIHVRETTIRRTTATKYYLNLVRKNLRETQDVYLEAGRILNPGAVRHILEVEKTRLKRVVLGATSEIIREILSRMTDAQCDKVDSVELKCDNIQRPADVGVLQHMRVFPHLRKLWHELPLIPNAAYVGRLANLTDLVLVNLRSFTVEDVHQLFDILTRAKHLTSFTLASTQSATHNPLRVSAGGAVRTTEIEFHHLKRFELQLGLTPLLLALLKPLRFYGEMERVVIATDDIKGVDFNGLVIYTMALAFSHMSAPETMKMGVNPEVLYTKSDGDAALLTYQAGWVDKPDRQLYMVLPVQEDISDPFATPIHPYLSLPFGDPHSWLLNNIQEMEVGTRPIQPVWECFARIPSLRRLSVTAWDMNDYFIPALRLKGFESPDNPPNPAQVAAPFPALLDIKIDMAELATSGLDVEYARTLAQALGERAANGSEREDSVRRICKLEFVSCTSQIDGETRDLLSGVASEVCWNMKKK
ncbi:hypothetical protein D9611_009862 [Ephemerocybe angulata]|uniref:F-box domain-containing protein n=1 Tax=Ephemerocybe angulata TaxID=980116 RepID=A0A8H5FK72_9AGAR|nr:hypothetical protein D9611_009862 [Tulosesus angulatus]